MLSHENTVMKHEVDKLFKHAVDWSTTGQTGRLAVLKCETVPGSPIQNVFDSTK